MPISTWIDDCNNTFSKPYIPQKIVGFSGIDPDLVTQGDGGSSGGSGETVTDHEQLDNLQGGATGQHYHLDAHTYMHVVDVIQELFMKNGVSPAQTNFIGTVLRESTLNALIDARIAAYQSSNS